MHIHGLAYDRGHGVLRLTESVILVLARLRLATAVVLRVQPAEQSLLLITRLHLQLGGVQFSLRLIILFLSLN